MKKDYIKKYKKVMPLLDDKFFVIDNSNYIANLHLGVPVDIDIVKQKVNNIVGVLDMG